MVKTGEKRIEQRLCYDWPISFGKDLDQQSHQGQMVDISSSGAAFICHSGENCPEVDQKITARFSVPRMGPGQSLDTASFVRTGKVCRIDDVNMLLRCVAVQFAEPLTFKPGEQIGR